MGGPGSCGRQWRDYKVAAVCITQLSVGGREDPSSGTGFGITSQVACAYMLCPDAPMDPVICSIASDNHHRSSEVPEDG